MSRPYTTTTVQIPHLIDQYGGEISPPRNLELIRRRFLIGRDFLKSLHRIHVDRIIAFELECTFQRKSSKFEY